MPTVYAQANDPYANFSGTPGSYGNNAAAVSASDTADLATYPKSVVVTVAGNLVVLPLKAADDGSHLITFTAAPVGFQPPFRIRRVMSTGTTATVAAISD